MIKNLIVALAQYIDTCAIGTAVVCNDINLTIEMGGSREYFDNLHDALSTRTTLLKLHFKNSNRNNYYSYGIEYDNNNLIMPIDDKLEYFNPYKICASAQMIIIKK